MGPCQRRLNNPIVSLYLSCAVCSSDRHVVDRASVASHGKVERDGQHTVIRSSWLICRISRNIENGALDSNEYWLRGVSSWRKLNISNSDPAHT